MDEYKKYLTDRLLSEEQAITYRLLSRALDVHVDTAKEMLYEYHVYQNSLKPNAVHATYLVYGIKASERAQEDGDVEMSSSMPEHEPISENVLTTTITLVREENLQDTLAGYKKATSVHIYSLAPHPQRDLSLLSDVSQSMSEYASKEVSSAAARKYGTVINPHIRLRERMSSSKTAVASTQKPAKMQPSSTKPEPSAPQPKPAPTATNVKQEAVAETTSKDTTSSSSAGKATPSLKRGRSGGIMQSFAKAASKPAKPKQGEKTEDATAALSDDGEAEEDDIAPSDKANKDTDTTRKSKKEREDELRRMMEEDDGDEEEPVEKEKEPEDEEMEEAPEPEPEPQPEAKGEDKPTEVVSSTGNGRRRGRRRVMTKKRMLDDQGYMVTVQEPGWESFSEDEAPQPPKKLNPTPASSSSGGKAKKPAGKGGQGNIMSFFSKK